MTASKRDETIKETKLAIETLENRDAPKKLVGGDLGNTSLEPGRGKPLRPRQAGSPGGGRTRTPPHSLRGERPGEDKEDRR
jgi:hypothetical protein